MEVQITYPDYIFLCNILFFFAVEAGLNVCCMGTVLAILVHICMLSLPPVAALMGIVRVEIAINYLLVLCYLWSEDG